jgi:hypothetical protein
LLRLGTFFKGEGELSNKQLLLSRRVRGPEALALQLTLRVGMVVRSRTAKSLDRTLNTAGTPMRAILPLVLILWSAPLLAQDTSGHVGELRRLHNELLEAHRTGDVDRWMSIEAPEYVSANGGRVMFPELSDRRAQRADYLGSATFDVYRDLREPLVRVSEDGSLGWLIAEVEVRGSIPSGSGEPQSFHDIWAWVELYENEDGAWRLVGNVSNRRPGVGNDMH